IIKTFVARGKTSASLGAETEWRDIGSFTSPLGQLRFWHYMGLPSSWHKSEHPPRSSISMLEQISPCAQQSMKNQN
uniref:Uncharacterized protein n=1 Tax=Chelonoidis abingdonii TaxID=106734 RepID=A0A8C0HDS6_CHEAB